MQRSFLHRFFEVAVILKGLHAIAELIGAVIIFFTSGATLSALAISVVSKELVEDPNDVLANVLLSNVSHVTQAGKEFAALYLFISALINLILASGLLMHKKIMFPIASVLLALFALFQLYLYTQTHSLWLIALSAYDCAIIVLVYLEYRRRWPTVISTIT
ncbi:MAG: membrane protein [Parcubacteria group bacterium Gr01-1014_8]|nr:MAG: membrane protein [Parcubacteria group bacterium Gr01-1014_8]